MSAAPRSSKEESESPRQGQTPGIVGSSCYIRLSHGREVGKHTRCRWQTICFLGALAIACQDQHGLCTCLGGGLQIFLAVADGGHFAKWHVETLADGQQ